MEQQIGKDTYQALVDLFESFGPGAETRKLVKIGKMEMNVIVSYNKSEGVGTFHVLLPNGQSWNIKRAGISDNLIPSRREGTPLFSVEEVLSALGIDNTFNAVQVPESSLEHPVRRDVRSSLGLR